MEAYCGRNRQPGRRRVASLLILAWIAAVGCGGGDVNVAYDVVLRGGTVYDGAGGAPVMADVGIRGDRIVGVGDLAGVEAREILDVSGLAVAPGFINVHSWSTGSLLIDGRSMSELKQGVTTEVFGEGVTLAPLEPGLREFFETERDRDYPPPGYDITWTTLREYLEHLESKGITPNVASLVGATTLRRYVVGDANVDLTPAQLDTVRALVDRAMREGALGVGSRLAYAPASYASTAELVAMAEVAGRYGGRYMSHIRSEGGLLLESVDELIKIAREGGLGATIYHLKAAGRENWDKLDDVIGRVEAARAEGLDVNAAMYPYRAGSTGLDASIPPWAHAGGPDSLRIRLRDPAVRERIAADIRSSEGDWENFYRLAGSPENILLVEFRKDSLQKYQGRTLAEVAGERGTDPVVTLLDLVLEDESLVQSVYFLMSEENLKRKLRLPWVTIGSDAPSIATTPEFTDARVHPRAYGSFAKVLSDYVREEKVIPLEEAIRRMTSYPADFLKLEGRGRIAEGAFADVVVFDPATIDDRATYEEPHQYAVGVHHVFINGVQVLRDGEHTGAFPGRALERGGEGDGEGRRAPTAESGRSERR